MDAGQQIPVFRPTWDEFKDFNQFILTIEKAGAHKAGLAKIIPPPEWKPRATGYDMNVIGEIEIPAPISQVVQGKQGVYQLYNIQKGHMKVKDFKRLAESTRYSTPTHFDYEDLDRKYWRNISYFPPIYGADVSGSLTDAEVKEWNINKLGSVLDLVEQDYGISIEGVNTAYLYFGMWKSSFAWHTEDMELYSINYLHFGEPKSWYCVPPEHGARLERLANNFFPGNAKECPAYLRHKMTVISPTVLKTHSIPCLKIVQEAGEIMITFPYAYHAGFNHGFNCAESTNFASPRWVEYGKRAIQCSCRPDMVKISMDTFVKRFQPERYELWLQGKDIGPHPEIPGRNSAAPHPSRDEILCNKNNSTLPETYVEPSKKKAKRHLIHEKLEPPVEQIQAEPIKSEQTEPVKLEGNDSSDESTIDEETADSLKDIYYRAGILESDEVDDEKKVKEDESWEIEDDDEEETQRKALKRPKPCSRPQVKARKIAIEPQIIQPAATRQVVPKLNSQLNAFKIPKKVTNLKVDDIRAWDIPTNVVSPVRKAFYETTFEKFTGLQPKASDSWRCKPAPKPESLSRRKQKCPKSNRSCVDNRELTSNLNNLWSQQRTWTLPKEAEFNLLQSRQEPHCSVCSLLRSPKSRWEQEIPANSQLLVPESLFGGTGKEETNSPLINCVSCRMCVHTKCYGLPNCQVDQNWLCQRCEANDETAKCCLCLHKGGALKATSDGRWAHITCALCFPGVAFEQPILREPIVIGQMSRESVSQLKCVFCSGKAENSSVFYRGMSMPCSGTLHGGKKCIKAFHPMCGLVNGVQFSLNTEGKVAGVCCLHALQKPIPKRRNQEDLPIGQVVYAKHPDGRYCLADIMDNTQTVTYYWVDFSDGSSSKDTYPEDIRNYNCKEDGPPPPGAAVDVLWTDGKRYGGFFRGTVHRQLYSLRFKDGEDITVTAERKEFYHPEEDIPKRVRDQLEKLGIFLNSLNQPT